MSSPLSSKSLSLSCSGSCSLRFFAFTLGNLFHRFYRCRLHRVLDLGLRLVPSYLFALSWLHAFSFALARRLFVGFGWARSSSSAPAGLRLCLGCFLRGLAWVAGFTSALRASSLRR